MNAPPPPPPHGENPRSTGSGLPNGKFDIFIVPEHSAGSGFLYLPSLKPSINSFVAGYACALVSVAVCAAIYPVVSAWYHGAKNSGGFGMILLMLAIGLGAWALGRTQGETPDYGGRGAGAGGHSNPFGAQQQQQSSNGYSAGGAPPPPPPNAGPPPQQAPPPSGGPKPTSWSNEHASESSPPPQPKTAPPPSGASKPSSWSRPAPSPGASPKPKPKPFTPKSATSEAWERTKAEAKRKEEERKAAEEAKKRKEENDKRLKELREKDAKERAERERKAAEKKITDEKKLAADNELAAEKRAAVEKELAAARKLAADKAATEAKPVSSSYAFSSTGEKTNPWPNGRPKTPVTPTRAPPISPFKKPPPPTANTYRGTDDDAFSYRPYDAPRHPGHKKGPSSVWSESSYAASQSTSRTTPPPSHRGAYSTKDPDKIVLKAVYSFNNSFLKTPTSQLVSGIGPVTDGLILRITTEGLFIDDDVRGVPQREWDVKAWTMKLVEVWCPNFSSSASASAFNSWSAAHNASSSTRPLNPVRRLMNLEKEKVASSEEAAKLVGAMLDCCKNICRFASSSDSASSVYSAASPLSQSSGNQSNIHRSQTGKNEAAGLHILRASIRDQEGKRYVFILSDEEAWKVTVGLGKLRKGSQIRGLSVSSMSVGDSRSTLENLGWN